MLEKSESCAVLFADISGSTRLYVDARDEQARAIVARTLEVWSELTLASGGQVIQLRGDGMLCLFGTADAALTAAVGMSDVPYQEPLSMHAGMHAGPMLRDGEQLYGDVVNIAARMADIAKRFEIVMTEAAQALLSEPTRSRLRLIRKVPVKGKSEPTDIYLLANDKQALTDYRRHRDRAVRALRRAPRSDREHRGAGADRADPRAPAGAGWGGGADGLARGTRAAAGVVTLIRSSGGLVLLSASGGRCCARRGESPGLAAPLRPMRCKCAAKCFVRPIRRRDQTEALTQSALRAIASGAEGLFKIPIRSA